ncbi:MAG: SagB/ThcOx family dehydrogenase [Defluviitaleaceae bacterium]|nr:SagB/ThcOx family dehydrogenase [Defluviitaleaceae bacterium]
MQNLHTDNRKFMQCPSFKDIMFESDQTKGVDPPSFSKPIAGDIIKLPSFDDVLTTRDYMQLVEARHSLREYSGKPMTQAQLAFMLWSAQGVKSYRGNVATFRTVPSGGARHPFETYIAVQAIEGLAPGLYRYLPLENVGEKAVTIERLGSIEDYTSKITAMLAGQAWAAKAPVILFYSCIPYRAEWRYDSAAHRVVLIDLGHLGQNVMLSAVALGLGSCCMAAFDQQLCDDTLGFDGLDEYTVYAISVGEGNREGNKHA